MSESKDKPEADDSGKPEIMCCIESILSNMKEVENP